MENRPLSVAVIGAGPAGIYASDILSKSNVDVQIDLFEKLPAPYGLVRYGVAPDHPRIKAIIDALYKILQRGDIRLLGNVEVGKDITVDDLHAHYDAVIMATGSDKDRALNIPGVDLPQCYGAADFVSWYDGNPLWPREWNLEAKDIAIIGAGNVALDIGRVLAKHWEDMLVTEIPDNVVEGLKKNPVENVHIFARRGPAQVKFTPLELRELGQQNDVDVIVDGEDIEFDEGSEAAIAKVKQTKMVVKTLMNYAMTEPEEQTASRRIYIHMFHTPHEILADEQGNVRAFVTERTRYTEASDGNVEGTGEYVEWPVQAVYRAIGYFSSEIPGVPFDKTNGVIPNVEGRVVDTDGNPVPGMYATGWVKRGPVGLIGSTKSDALETIGHILEDAKAGKLHATTEQVGHDAMIALLEERGVKFTTWHGWELLDEFEQQMGQDFGEVKGDRGPRQRIKVVSRAAMAAISRNEDVPDDLIGAHPGD
ncbi:MAG: FAD-dependent oxidoreductase [Actinomycetaceae bacterium]|nr:FAD-dependent oxidoreductase [Actinomycetaceae bacterium]